jgi:2-(1,2-epoxy-1,2-dihydrophenyl)acetyl-CoA isomerase
LIVGQYAGFGVEARDQGICVVTFDRPKSRNSFTAAMKRDLIELLTQAQYDDETRILIFTGKGSAFCAGDDFIGYWNDDNWSDARVPPLKRKKKDGISSYGSLRMLSHNLNRAVRNLDKLTIAAINGPAIQSGLSFALACDFRLAAPQAKLGSATLKLGFLPDEGGHFLLLQHLGLAKTMDFLMRKRIFNADEALAAGLVSEIVRDHEGLLDSSIALALELAEGPQTATRLLKRAIYNATQSSWEQACEDIATRTAIADHHSDRTEGVRAWREKRPPKFNQE